MNIKGEYRITIKEPDDSDGWFIATIDSFQGSCITQGRNENEILDMIADCIKTAYDIKVPWYDRWYATLRRWLNLY